MGYFCGQARAGLQRHGGGVAAAEGREHAARIRLVVILSNLSTIHNSTLHGPNNGSQKFMICGSCSPCMCISVNENHFPGKPTYP